MISAVCRNSPLTWLHRKVFPVTLAAILCCTSFYWFKNPIVANYCWSCYLILLDFVVYQVLETVMLIWKEEIINTAITRTFKKVYFSFVLIDACFIIFNAKTNLVFSLVPVTVEDVYTTWQVYFNRLFWFHSLLCYTAIFATFISLIRCIIKTSKYSRPVFVWLLVVFVITVASNGFFIITAEHVIFDYSVIIYGFNLAFAYLYMTYLIPRQLQKNLISLSSDNIKDGIICFDDSDRCVYCNKAAETFYKDTEANRQWANAYLTSDKDVVFHTEKIYVENKIHTFKVEFRRIRDNQKRKCGSYIRLNDCTQEVLSMEKESYRATHDELTGLYNRTFFFKEMKRILTEQPDVPRYLVCTDIKDFKLVNELFGSKFGDRVLVRQAEMLKAADYPDVIHGRISGDRYAMLIPVDKFNPELAKNNTDKIVELEKEVNFRLIVYIGVYQITNPEENVHTIYDKANLAIKNIQPGLNQFMVFYDDEIMNKVLLEKNIVSEFNTALATEQFEMYLQPQIEVSSGKCLGAEALVRWNFPGRGQISPASFIKALEKSDQIYRLDYFIWEKAVQKLAEWKERNIDYYISINISVKDFYYADLFEYFKNLVEKYGVNPDKLHLEITESVVISDNLIHRKVLKKLQDYGFEIEMDDFGSGYSSLNVLKDMSMNVLKLDMGFLQINEDESRANKIIASIVKMAKALNMRTISEGVETQHQADMLSKIGVDVFQGFLYSKPIAVEDFEKKYLEIE